jgi:hypothetical protein
VSVPTIDVAVERLTPDEAKILATYASGETSLDAIAEKTGVRRTEVDHVIMNIANFNAAHARSLAIAWQRKNSLGMIGTAPSPSPPAVEVKPKLSPKATAAPAPAEPIANLINRAIASGDAKLVKLCDKIQDLVDQLEEDVKEYERGASLRAEADRLEQRLAEIRQELGGKATGAVQDTKAIRAWAEKRGIECPARGRIPASVLAAYREVNS